MCADLEQDGVLILELVERVRLRRGRREHRGTRHLLVEVEPLDFARERQVLDGCPPEVGAELRDVKVGVTGVGAGRSADQCLARMAGGEGGAVGALGRGGSRTEQIVVRSAVIADSRVATEQARRPVRIPVVVERAADAPSRGQSDTAGTRRPGQVNAAPGR